MLDLFDELMQSETVAGQEYWWMWWRCEPDVMLVSQRELLHAVAVSSCAAGRYSPACEILYSTRTPDPTGVWYPAITATASRRCRACVYVLEDFRGGQTLSQVRRAFLNHSAWSVRAAPVGRR